MVGLDLTELKERAAEVRLMRPPVKGFVVDHTYQIQHITKSLTVENIAYEVFSPFAAAFETIRKVDFCLLLTFCILT
jgi:hypothetical protein